MGGASHGPSLLDINIRECSICAHSIVVVSYIIAISILVSHFFSFGVGLLVMLLHTHARLRCSDDDAFVSSTLRDVP